MSQWHTRSRHCPGHPLFDSKRAGGGPCGKPWSSFLHRGWNGKAAGGRAAPLMAHLCVHLCSYLPFIQWSLFNTPMSVNTGSAPVCVNMWATSSPSCHRKILVSLLAELRGGSSRIEGRTPAGPTAFHMYMKAQEAQEASGTSGHKHIGFKTLMYPGNIFFTENLSCKCQQMKRFLKQSRCHTHLQFNREFETPFH